VNLGNSQYVQYIVGRKSAICIRPPFAVDKAEYIFRSIPMFRLSAILVSLMLTLAACTEVATGTYEGNARSGTIANFGSGGIRLDTGWI
jgi:hypothetical protein